MGGSKFAPCPNGLARAPLLFDTMLLRLRLSVLCCVELFHFSLRGFLSIIFLFYSFLQFIYLLSLPHARTLVCHTAKLAIGQVGQQGRGNLHTSRRYVGDSETDVDD